MGIKLDEKTKMFTVSYCKRHPKTFVPLTLRRKGIKSKSEANRIYGYLVLEVERKIHKTLVPCWKVLVDEFVQDFANRDISKKTVECYQACLEAHTFSDWKDRLSDSITSQEIRDLIKIKVGHRSPSHQKNVLKYIRSAFNYGLERAWLSRNPTPQMKFRIGDKLKEVLTLGQVKSLLTQAKIMESEWYPIWAMALYTGMRNGELFALTWDKVNLEQRQIRVDCSWNNKDGFKGTKSGDDRIVEVALELHSILQELKIQNLNPPFVLPRIDKWERGDQARELRRYLEGLGLPRIRFHDLRATWATLLLSRGIEAIKVMKMGGWKDLKTMQFYIRKAGVDIKGMMDNFDLHNPSRTDAKFLTLELN